MPEHVLVSRERPMSERPTVIGDAATAYRLGMEALGEEDIDRAVELLVVATRFAPEDVDAHVALGIARARKLDVYAAIDALERAVDLDSGHFAARLHLGELYLKLRIAEPGRAHLEAALALARTVEERAGVRRMLKQEAGQAKRGVSRPSFAPRRVVPPPPAGDRRRR